jgi:hypothetical protein
VLTDLPEVRVKRLEDEKIQVIRMAEPEMYPNENRVNVNYHVLIKDKMTGIMEELQECHKMRYLFLPEVSDLLVDKGMELLAAKKWMSEEEPGFDTWSVCFVARMKAE